MEESRKKELEAKLQQAVDILADVCAELKTDIHLNATGIDSDYYDSYKVSVDVLMFPKKDNYRGFVKLDGWNTNNKIDGLLSMEPEWEDNND